MAMVLTAQQNQILAEALNLIENKEDPQREQHLIELFSQNTALINEETNGYTLLQHCCDHSLTEAAKWLIENGADPTKVGQTSYGYDKPLEMVSYYGLSELVELLFDRCDPDEEETKTAFFLAIKTIKSPPSEKENPITTLKIITNHIRKKKFVIKNWKDELGNTPLFLALYLDVEEGVDAVRPLGTSLGETRYNDSLCLEVLTCSSVEKLFDKSINVKVPGSDLREMSATCDCTMLLPLDSDRQEFEVIFYMTHFSKFTPLLAHPLILSFLCTKWQNNFFWRKWQKTIFIRLFHAIIHIVMSALLLSLFIFENFAFKICSLLIVILVSIFQYMYYYIVFWRNRESLKKITEYPLKRKLFFSCAGPLFITIACLSTIFTKDISNLKDFLLIAAFIYQCFKVIDVELSNYAEMFKIVLWNTCKALVCYSFVFVAFTVCYFKIVAGNKSDSIYKDIFSLLQSFYKVFTLLTGELRDDDTLDDSLQIGFFFVLVLVFPIVLINLLNGLAVSDVQQLRDDAMLVKIKERIRFVYLTEIFLDWLLKQPVGKFLKSSEKRETWVFKVCFNSEKEDGIALDQETVEAWNKFLSNTGNNFMIQSGVIK